MTFSHALVSRRQALGLLSAAAGGAALPGWAVARPAASSGVVAIAAGKADGSLYKASAGSLHRSNDAGQSWRQLALPALAANGGIASLSAAAGDQHALYLAGPRLGVLRSADGGGRWASADNGLPRGVTAVAAHARQPDTVYAHVPRRGIYRSEDAGRRWRLMDAGPRGGITRFVHSDMAGSMQSGWLFVAGPQGVRLSMDCFCGWRNAGDMATPAHAITFDPRTPSRIVAATAGGLVESPDGGQSWSPLPGSGVAITALAFGPDGTLYAARDTELVRRTPHGWERLGA